MLIIETGARNSSESALMVEGNRSWNGMCTLTKEVLESVAKLPEGYTVGTVTRDDNFWYKVVEI